MLFFCFKIVLQPKYKVSLSKYFVVFDSLCAPVDRQYRNASALLVTSDIFLFVPTLYCSKLFHKALLFTFAMINISASFLKPFAEKHSILEEHLFVAFLRKKFVSSFLRQVLYCLYQLRLKKYSAPKPNVFFRNFDYFYLVLKCSF